MNKEQSKLKKQLRLLLHHKKLILHLEKDGGTSMAVLASFAATFKEVGVDFEAWLNDILIKLYICPAAEVRTLLPRIRKNAR